MTWDTDTTPVVKKLPLCPKGLCINTLHTYERTFKGKSAFYISNPRPHRDLISVEVVTKNAFIFHKKYLKKCAN